MKYTVDTIPFGKPFTVHNQGTNITPCDITVTVFWIGPDRVHYIIHGGNGVKETSIERFLEIINQ
jgi:hypothetical protein